MWVMTKYGFFSAVCARKGTGKKNELVDPARIMLRARNEQHLRNLQARFPELIGDVKVSYAGSDYACRLFIDKQAWVIISAEMASETDYDNFKTAVGAAKLTDPEYISALMATWSTMYAYQRRAGRPSPETAPGWDRVTRTGRLAVNPDVDRAQDRVRGQKRQKGHKGRDGR